MKKRDFLKNLAVFAKGRTRKFWVAIIVILMSGSATAAVMAWEHPSNFNLTSSHASVAFETVVTGISTNANQTPLSINGHNYNLDNVINFNYISHGNGGMASNVNLQTGNFLPGDYVQFQVTVTNTGGTTLLLNSTDNNYTYSNYFVNSQGQYINSPDQQLYGNGYNNSSSPMNYTGFGDAPTTQQVLTLMGSSGWNINWVNWWGSASVIPHELKHGQSFTYDLYIGLGDQAAYNIPDQYFSLNVFMPPAR
ncbi:hypothetical protein IX51_03095 [uncultured archaeon]|nr:hypothetical protein IX51_03095 [uncultured archaeon]HKJ96274.1 hypothetical protein [Thermoplasmataceae archaeon]